MTRHFDEFSGTIGGLQSTGIFIRVCIIDFQYVTCTPPWGRVFALS